MADVNKTPPADRKLVTPHSPAQGVSAPSDKIFREHNNQYLQSPDAQKVANGLMERYHRFDHLQSIPITYLWKQTGGMTKGRANWGGIKKADDIHRLGDEAFFYVWVAADNARDSKMNRFQFEALMFDLLCRVEEKLDKDGEPTGEMGIVGPEFEGFYDTVRNYGFWNQGLEVVRDISLQIPMFTNHGDPDSRLGAEPAADLESVRSDIAEHDERLNEMLVEAKDLIEQNVEGVTVEVNAVPRRGPGRPRKEQPPTAPLPVDTPV